MPLLLMILIWTIYDCFLWKFKSITLTNSLRQYVYFGEWRKSINWTSDEAVKNNFPSRCPCSWLKLHSFSSLVGPVAFHKYIILPKTNQNPSFSFLCNVGLVSSILMILSKCWAYVEIEMTFGTCFTNFSLCVCQ